MRKNNGAITILGGMGPQASGYMYKLLVDKSVRDFGARNNDEFPEIILFSIPVPDFISSDENKKKTQVMLIERVQKLNGLNVSCVAIACNTAHILIKDLKRNTTKPFVSIIDCVADEVKKRKYRTVGLFATVSTVKFGLYQDALKKHGVETLVPTSVQQKSLDNIIRRVLAQKNTEKDVKCLKTVVNSLRKRGAEAIILGCTELPLIFPQNYEMPVVNSLEVLTDALLERYYGVKARI